MDGFSTTRTFISCVHPALIRKAPPANQPLYIHTEDISLFKQDLCNYYLRYYLHTKVKTSDYDQAEQYIKGLETTLYKEGCRRIYNKLDPYDSSQELDHNLSFVYIYIYIYNKYSYQFV